MNEDEPFGALKVSRNASAVSMSCWMLGATFTVLFESAADGSRREAGDPSPLPRHAPSCSSTYVPNLRPVRLGFVSFTVLESEDCVRASRCKNHLVTAHNPASVDSSLM